MSTPVKIDSSNFGRYTVLAAVNPAAGIGVPELIVAHNRALAVFLCTMHSYILIMVGRAGASQDAPGSTMTGYANPARLTTLEIGVSRGELSKLIVEAANMATIPAIVQPKYRSNVTTSLSDYLRLLRLSGIPGYIRGVAVNPATGRCNPELNQAHNRAKAVFLCAARPHHSMVGRAGQLSGWPGSWLTGIATPARLATHERCNCQQRVKSDPLTVTTNGLILIHLVYSGLASAITPAFRFCFSR